MSAAEVRARALEAEAALQLAAALDMYWEVILEGSPQARELIQYRLDRYRDSASRVAALEDPDGVS